MPNGGTRRRPAAATTRKRPAAAAQPDAQPDKRFNHQPREMMELKKWKTQFTEHVMGKPWVGTLKGLAWDAVANEVTEQWKWAPEKGNDDDTSKGTDKNADTGKDGDTSKGTDKNEDKAT